MLFSERLSNGHSLDGFTSGNDVLDDWLKHHAVTSDRSGSGRTYVVLDAGGDIAAYFTLAPHVVTRKDVPSSVGRGSPDAIPAVLLARLAVHRARQGSGLGGSVLAHALEIALEAIRVAGGRLIVVDAIDANAASFYAHHGFIPVPENPHRLVIKASVVARSLDLRWP